MTDTAARVIVPVAEVAAEAYRSVFGQLSLLFDRAWLPLLIMLAATLVPGYLHFYVGWRGFPTWRGDAYGLGIDELIEALAGLLCLNAFAVRWHQTMLFAGETPPPPAAFTGAWLRFLLYTVLLYLVSTGLIAGLLLAGAAGTPNYAVPAAGILATLVWVATVRCSLLFPAAAFGRPLSVVVAWRAMRGNSWRLLGCGVVACAPVILFVIMILSGLLAFLHLDQASSHLPLGFFILRAVIGTCANFTVVAIGASVLSSFYRRILLRGLNV